MRYLEQNEIVEVCGAGLFTSIGEALDNPWTTIGRVVDGAREAVLDAVGGPIQTGYYANGVYNIK